MSSPLSFLGLSGASNSLSTISNQAPSYAIFNFLFSYVFMSTRWFKSVHGLDHNVNPREDVARFSERAVKDGKITQRQSNKWKRWEAAHANSVEHFPMFVGSILFATVAGLPNLTINKACAAYSASRIIYCISYILIESRSLSYVRSLAWWASNITCMYLLWDSGKAFNSALKV